MEIDRSKAWVCLAVQPRKSRTAKPRAINELEMSRMLPLKGRIIVRFVEYDESTTSADGNDTKGLTSSLLFMSKPE
jgi:hypothetical protein